MFVSNSFRRGRYAMEPSMLIYDSSLLLTTLQSRHLGGIAAFESEGGIIMNLPMFGTIAIFHPHLDQEFKETMQGEWASKGVALAFVETPNFDGSTDEDIKVMKRDIAGFLMAHGLHTSRTIVNRLLVHIELPEGDSTGLNIAELCSYLMHRKAVSNLLVTCKDRTIVSESIWRSAILGIRDVIGNAISVEDVLSRSGHTAGAASMDFGDGIGMQLIHPHTITELEVSLMMDMLMGIGRELMRKNGYLIPLLYAFCKDKEIDLQVDDEIVIERASKSFEEMYYNQKGTIHTSLLALCIGNLEQEGRMQTLANEMASHPDVDAIGLVEGGYYRQVVARTENEPLYLDPNSQRIIHACYYIRGHPTARLLNIPFIHRGGLDSLPDSDVRYDVHFANSTWVEDKEGSEGHRIEYPYP